MSSAPRAARLRYGGGVAASPAGGTVHVTMIGVDGPLPETSSGGYDSVETTNMFRALTAAPPRRGLGLQRGRRGRGR